MNQELADRNATVAELFQDESINKTAEEEISDIMGAGAVSINYSVNAAQISQNVETKQLVDVEVKDISDKVTMMYHNQIDMMSTQLQQIRVMLEEKDQEEQELKDKLTFEYQNNVNLRAQL